MIRKQDILERAGEWNLRPDVVENHVSKLKLTQTDTKQYVTSLLADDGKVPPGAPRPSGLSRGR